MEDALVCRPRELSFEVQCGVSIKAFISMLQNFFWFNNKKNEIT
jgi:hypothetical protein